MAHIAVEKVKTPKGIVWTCRFVDRSDARIPPRGVAIECAPGDAGKRAMNSLAEKEAKRRKVRALLAG